jgi:hypothetical protein
MPLAQVLDLGALSPILSLLSAESAAIQLQAAVLATLTLVHDALLATHKFETQNLKGSWKLAVRIIQIHINPESLESRISLAGATPVHHRAKAQVLRLAPLGRSDNRGSTKSES